MLRNIENMPRDTVLKKFLNKFKEKFKLNKKTGIILQMDLDRY